MNFIIKFLKEEKGTSLPDYAVVIFLGGFVGSCLLIAPLADKVENIYSKATTLIPL